MNGMDVYNSMTKLDESLLESALTGKKNRFKKAFIIKLAVCAVLIVAALITYAVIRRAGGDAAFVLTAYAANGEAVPLYTNGCMNNVPAGYQTNIFGNDEPCFSVQIWPEDIEGRALTYHYDISVRYEYRGDIVSVTAEEKDDHLRIGLSVKGKFDSHFSGYMITGQFSEPAAVYVYIKEKETGEYAESYRIQVEYSAERGEYELTVNSIDPPGRFR